MAASNIAVHRSKMGLGHYCSSALLISGLGHADGITALLEIV